jgi:adenylate cyclase
MFDGRRSPQDEQINNAIKSIKQQQMRLKQALAQMSDASRPATPAMLDDISGISAELDTLVSLVASEHIELLQLRALMKTWGQINSSLELQTVLTEAMNQVIQLTGAERGYILWRKPNTTELEFRVAVSMENDATDSSFEISRTVVNHVIQSGEPMLTDNAANDARIDSSMSIAAYALRSVLCVPLKDKTGMVVGVVYVANRLRVGVFTQRELTLLTAFANQAAIAIENARVFTRVKADLEKTKVELERLRIEVNEAQMRKQVSDITETDYFRDLASKVRELRRQGTPEDPNATP